jgi:hypothetical protein
MLIDALVQIDCRAASIRLAKSARSHHVCRCVRRSPGEENEHVEL